MSIFSPTMTFYTRESAQTNAISSSSTESCGDFEYSLDQVYGSVITLVDNGGNKELSCVSNDPADIVTYGFNPSITVTITMRLVDYPESKYPVATYPNLYVQ